MNRKVPWAAISWIIFVGLSCHTPSFALSSPTLNLVGTQVSETLTAIVPAAISPTSPLPAAAISTAPPPLAVLLTVSQATNCRTGPGINYDLLDTLNVGETAEAIGRHPAANYWIIKTPHGTGVCWLWGQYVSVISGDAESLAEILPPPSPTPPPPPTQQPLRVTSVRAFVSSEPWQGTCPHTFRVWAEITLNGDGSDTLRYRWHRSDGFVGPEHTLEVSAGAYTVEGEWRVTQDGSYRIQIEILSPTSIASEWSVFHEVDCR